MAEIKIPDLTGVQDALTDLAHRSGYAPSFVAFLGKGDGVTITDPDYPTPGANRYVWYYTESGRTGKAILQGGTIPYANQAEYHGLPVQIGKLPAAFNIPGEVVLGLGGIAGMSAAGGTQVIENLITNNYYTSLDKMVTLRPEPAATPDMTVSITGDFIYTNPNTGVLTRFATSSIVLSSLQSVLTAGKHRIAVICLDPTTNTLTTVASTPATATSSLPYRGIFTYTDVLALSLSGLIRIAPVYLYYGQTAITESDILRSLDVRSIFFPPELVQPPVFTGATGTIAGTKGQVPAPGATDNTKFLKGDGTWSAPSGGTGGTPVVVTSKTAQTRTLIGSTTLSTAAASISVGSIPSGYDELYIEVFATSSNSGSSAENAVIYINGDSTVSNYDMAQMYQYSTGVFGDHYFGTQYLIGMIPTAVSSTTETGFMRLRINEYAATKKHQVYAESAAWVADANASIMLRTVNWKTAAAITSVAIACGSGSNITAGSVMNVYGIKNNDTIVTGVTGGGGYGTIQNAGTPLAQESTLNFIAGSNVTLTIADNPGSTRTDVTIASTPSGAANLVYATPNLSSGSASLRALVATDIPAGLSGTLIGSGAVGITYGGTGSNLLATGPGFLKQATTGANVTVAALASGDIPSLPASILTSGQLALARGGTNADLSATGGTSQVLKQTTAGGAISVAQLAYSDLSGSISASQLPVANKASLLYFPSGINIDTTSTSFVACSTTNLRLTLTPSKSSASVLLMATFGAFKNTNGTAFYDVFIDGSTTRVGGTNGLVGTFGPSPLAAIPVTLVGIATGLSTSSHTFDLCFRSDNANVARVAGNTPVSFVAIEL